MAYEIKIVIDGQIFQGSSLLSANTENILCDDTFEIGQTACAKIELEIIAPTVPFQRMAEIIPYIREEGGSVWKEKGHYFISTRPVSGNIMKITGYDGMRKTGREISFTGVTFPATSRQVVAKIAAQSGLTLAPGTLDSLSADANIPNPDGYTGREILGFVGAMNGGSFQMNDAGQLQFVNLVSILTDLNKSYLITETGKYITFGGVRIIV